ncbi:hypothetical protein HK103_003484 [Boothiomyces macroporosus]|uniref:Fido domain-containing protein n=1 Tax=Boothiomyces macroporosus TaxID=261099 RepID=A0AAD5U8L9_9FUNG|nr:hypothetical protein HK103_003484 [Boothiomyces macroporosus]
MDKNSPEYIKLSKSGRNSTKTFEKEYEYFLKEIDDYNKARKMELHEINKIITTGLAQQSVALEGNSLKLGDSVIIWDALNGKNITNLPSAKELLPYAPEQEVIELRNQLILTKMVQETPIFDEEQLKKFHIILLQDTPMEIIRGIGKVQRSGNYRLNPILAKGYPLTIYPYPLEIQALMAELFKFKTDIKDKLHPIVAASRLLVTFLHIHPFHDGNGRMGRLLFMDYLIRNNYPPVLFSSINRTEYCDMVFEAQQGDATQLYLCILETMKNFQIELIS